MTTKMMNLFVANELWRNFQHTRFADVSLAIKKTIFEDKYWDGILSLRGEYQQKFGLYQNHLFLMQPIKYTAEIFRGGHHLATHQHGLIPASMHAPHNRYFFQMPRHRGRTTSDIYLKFEN